MQDLQAYYQEQFANFWAKAFPFRIMSSTSQEVRRFRIDETTGT